MLVKNFNFSSDFAIKLCFGTRSEGHFLLHFEIVKLSLQTLVRSMSSRLLLHRRHHSRRSFMDCKG